MADREFRVKARIQAVDEASGVIGKVQSSFAKLSKEIADRFVITLGDVTRAVRTIVSGFQSVVAASAEAEQANRRLDAALAPLGDSAARVADGLRKQADELQRTTKFGDEAIKEGQALLASFTQNEQQLGRSAQAAADLATVLGIDLRAAFTLLAKASQGNTSALGRYGISVSDAIPKSEKLAEVLRLIEGRWGGRAQADAKTFSGLIARVGNAFGELSEKAGDAVTGSTDVNRALAGLHSQLTDKGTIAAVAELARIFISFGSGAVSFGIEKIKSLVGIGQGLGATLSKAGIDVSKYFVPPLVESTRSIDGLVTASQAAGSTIGNVSAAATAAGAALSSLAVGAKNTAAAVGEAATQFEALDAAAKVLGEVTSIQLANEMLSINIALLSQRDALGATSAEYVRLETIATQKIELIRQRIESLRSGLGDVATASSDATTAVDDTADSFDDAATSANVYGTALRAQVGQLARVATQANATAAALRNVIVLQGLGGGVGVDTNQPINGGNRVAVVDRNGNRIGSRFVRSTGFGAAPSRFITGWLTYR